ncbi:DNA polymerase delta small subunit Cdc1 [Malassezia pachydermatis]
MEPTSSWARQCLTGVVAGVIGTETPDGDFEVSQVFFPGVPPPLAPLGDVLKGDIVLASGLYAGNAQDPSHDASLELLLEWLTGELSDASDRERTSRISSLVLAGNLVPHEAWAQVAPHRPGAGPHNAAATTTSTPGTAPNPVAALDPWLEQVCAVLDAVVVLPGVDDPSGATLPQQPWLAPLLPRASQWPSLHCVTNPAWFGLHQRRFLATSGQTIDDALKYLAPEAQAEHDAPLRMATTSLQWSHVAPTAPDTLCTYTYVLTLC